MIPANVFRKYNPTIHQRPRASPRASEKNRVSERAPSERNETHRLSILAQTKFDALTVPRCQDPLDGVRQRLLSMRDGDVGEERLEPTELGTREGIEPLAGRRKDPIDVVDVLGSRIGRFDRVRDVAAVEEGGVDRRGRGGEVVDHGDRRRVAVVVLVEELGRERRLDAAEEFADRLLGRRAVLDGDGTLEDADSLGVLVEDGLNVVGLPEGVLNNEQR